MTKLIRKSVGKGGTNQSSDVEVVQELLNKFVKVTKTPKLQVDGKIGKKTNEAIGEFQKKVVGLRNPDQRVDPGRDTIKALNGRPAAAAAAEDQPVRRRRR